jgi:hypothetical protein
LGDLKAFNTFTITKQDKQADLKNHVFHANKTPISVDRQRK